MALSVIILGENVQRIFPIEAEMTLWSDNRAGKQVLYFQGTGLGVVIVAWEHIVASGLGTS